MFYSYLAYSVVETVVFLAIPIGVGELYRWLAAGSTVVTFALEIGVIYELATKVILSPLCLSNALKTLLRRSTAVLVLMVTLLAAILPQHTLFPALQAYSTIKFSVNALDLGLLLTLVFASRLFGTSWETMPAGVAIGVAISNAGSMASAVLLNQMGPHYFIDFVLEGIGNVSALIFLACILLKDRASGYARLLPAPIPSLATAADQLSDELSKVIGA